MFRKLRETGPVVLVPLAWLFATAAHLQFLELRTVFIAHVVMDVLLFGFAALSWRDMQDHPILRTWLAVIVAGFGITLLGTYALATDGSETLLRATVFGWMLVPAVALYYTGRVLPAEEKAAAYTVGGWLSGLGAVFFVDATVSGPFSTLFAGIELTLLALALVCVGQTVGIVTAVLEY